MNLDASACALVIYSCKDIPVLLRGRGLMLSSRAQFAVSVSSIAAPESPAPWVFESVLSLALLHIGCVSLCVR